MKKNIAKSVIAVLLVLLGNMHLNAQSKSDLEATVAKQKTTIDSMSTRLSSLEIMYGIIKDSLLMRDFDPSKFSTIVDSIKNSADSATLSIAQYQAKQKSLTDTITTLKAANTKMNTTIDNSVVLINLTSSKTITREELENGLDATRQELVTQLEQLKSLMDAGILTQEEYDAKKQLILAKW